MKLCRQRNIIIKSDTGGVIGQAIKKEPVREGSDSVDIGGAVVIAAEPQIIGGNVGLVFFCNQYAAQYSNLNSRRDDKGQFSKIN